MNKRIPRLANDVKMETRHVSVFYGEQAGDRQDIDLDIAEHSGDSAHRAFRLRQEYLPAHSEPHERHHRQGLASRAGGDARWPRYLRPKSVDACRGSSPRRHGLPEIEPLSRSRSSRTSPLACASPVEKDKGAEIDSAGLRVTQSDAALWDEVKDRLAGARPSGLSGGQQQRLCIARCTRRSVPRCS